MRRPHYVSAALAIGLVSIGVWFALVLPALDGSDPPALPPSCKELTYRQAVQRPDCKQEAEDALHEARAWLRRHGGVR